MTDADTHRIEESTLAGGAGDREYLHKARKLGADGPSEYVLRDTETARCHILSDSNTRIIVNEICSSLKKAHKTVPLVQLPDNVRKFIAAMTDETDNTELEQLMLADVRSSSPKPLNRGTVMHRLSHGAANLFFGDANRNGIVLHGLDVPLEEGRPTRNAARIIEAVGGLGYESLVRFPTVQMALTPTVARVNGQAVSSSRASAYPTEIRFSEPHHPARLSRSASIPKDWKPK